MRKSEINVGGHYIAKVNGKLVTVRVDDIRLTSAPAAPSARTGWTYSRDVWLYDVTNLSTGRKTTFRSAAKFRAIAGVENLPRKRGDRLATETRVVECDYPADPQMDGRVMADPDLG